MAAVHPRTHPRANTAPTTLKSKPTTLAAPNNDAHTGGKGGTSPLSVFFTNLRLLDLDLLPDWPDITIETFASTRVQGQKRRIQYVEWVLVKLFEIWDPEEFTLRLSPLFPSHDQIQSVNLRAVLLRALETVKKNGFLGRDTVIRKTMLDDCKGERLEEVLACFSTAVLKKVVEDNMNASDEHPSISMSLALESRCYDSDNTELHILGLAYKASLRRFLEQKQDIRALYYDFDELLSIKERGITRRMEAVRGIEADSSRDTLSSNARQEMCRLVRNNWSGNEKWMNTLIKGDNQALGGGLLDMPFNKVWQRVQQGRLGEIEMNSGGLLEQLDSRVQLQKERLAKWSVIRSSIFGRPGGVSSSPSKKGETSIKPNRGIDFQFSAHRGLQVGVMPKSLGIGQRHKPGFSSEYDKLLSKLKDELASIKSTDTAVIDFLTHTEPRRRRYGNSLDQSIDGGEAVSDISELEDEPYESITAPILVRTDRAKLESLRRHTVKPQMATSEIFNQSTSTQSSLSPPRDQGIYIPPPSDLQEIASPRSPTQSMADDILEAIEIANPSPTKLPRQRPTLSLVQRTRLSMAGSHSPFLDEEPELPIGPAPSRTRPGPTPTSESDSSREGCEPMDLASRTRLSMAGFEKSQKKAQLERRKSLRRSKVLSRKEGSYFPRVDEENAHDHKALTQELLLEEDMEAVFKSRPKMRTSPVGTPVR